MVQLVAMNHPLTRPWDEIEQLYAGHAGESIEAMRSLVSVLRDSRYADSLFAWTSMWDLCISQVPEDHPNTGPHLRISPAADGTIEFRYIDTPRKEHQWHRTVPAAESFPRLQKFFAQLNWFPPH